MVKNKSTTKGWFYLYFGSIKVGRRERGKSDTRRIL